MTPRPPAFAARTSAPKPAAAGSQDQGSMRPPHGMSLVELMIALVLGLFLVGGIIQLLVTSRATYRLAETQARAQENGRYALQFLAREVRPGRSTACRNIAQEEIENSINVLACGLLADLSGCAGDAKIGTRTPLGYSPSQPSADWLAGLPGSATSGPRYEVGRRWLRGDVLVSWGVFGEGFYARSDMLETEGTPALNAPIKLIAATRTADISDAGLKSGHLALITDCEASDVFAISNTADETREDPRTLKHGGVGSLNKKDTLSRLYNRTGTALSPGTTVRARVFPFDLRAYFVCCVDQVTGLRQTDGAVGACGTDPQRFRPALCIWSAAAADTQALVLDVADLRVTYDGRLDPSDAQVRDSSSQVRFADLDAVPNAAWVQTHRLWHQVDTARIELLVTGGDEARGDRQSPSLAASASTSGLGQWKDENNAAYEDRRLYQTFDTTIAIRSRAPWYPSP